VNITYTLYSDWLADRLISSVDILCVHLCYSAVTALTTTTTMLLMIMMMVLMLVTGDDGD